MRSFAPVVLALLLTSCATDRIVSPDGVAYRIRRDVCCKEVEGSGGEAECAKRATTEKGCSWQAGLICRGVDTPEEIAREEARVAAACEMRCACVCDSDREACSMVP